MDASSPVLTSRCPACQQTTLGMQSVSHEIPYFGECLETLFKCTSCSFRHTDFLILNQKEPVEYRLALEAPEDLGARVVRANSGTFSVPELGFVAEPTPRSEAFVTNAQGILDRAREVLLTAITVYRETEPEKADIAESKLAHLARIEALEVPGTIVIADPFGNSAILSERAQRRILTQAEAAELETGYVIFDRSEFEGA